MTSTSTYTKHAPGPWRVKANGPSYNITSEARDDPHMILVGMVYNEPEEHSANARLIAAAPDLLDALKRVVDKYEECNPNDVAHSRRTCPYCRARAAITKAESGLHVLG
jgi:hypothetical protein